MLKRNDRVIKLFLALYLVIIYDLCICIYMCEYVYQEYECTWLHMCIFMFYLLFGIENDFVILFISHNKG